MELGRIVGGTRRARAASRGPAQALLVMVLGLLVIPAVSSAAGPAFALQVTGSRAPYFVFHARPGARIRGRLSVVNASHRAGAVTLVPVDAETGATSGAVYASPQAPRRAVGAWIHLSRRRLRLGPGRSRVVRFEVTVPRRARGGQHLGWIVASPVRPVQRVHRRHGRASFHVVVRAISVIAVQLDLPGRPRPHLRITGVHAGAESNLQTLLIGLGNTGNVLTRGRGTIVVTDAADHRRLRRTFRLNTFVPGTRIEYPVGLTGGSLGSGRYRARISVRYAGHRTARTLTLDITSRNLRETFGSQPSSPPSSPGHPSLTWLILGGIAVLLAGVALGFRGRGIGRPRRT